MMKRLLLLFSFLLYFENALAQSVLIDPAAGGGFESGNTFASNGWSSTNGSSNPRNHWVCGNGANSGFSGLRCGYITKNNTLVHEYNNGTARVSHLYRDITVPAGETSITLSFLWIANGEANFDYLKVWKVPTTTAPVYGAAITASVDNIDLTGELQGTTSWQNNTFTLPTSLAGTSFRLVFEWRNNNSAGNNPPAGVDNISLTSESCPTYSGTMTVGPTGTFTNLTNAVAQLENCGFSGNITLELQTGYTSSGETFPITFPNTLATSATTTITIKPENGANSSILGSVSNDALLKILASHINIDGSNNSSSSRNLTIENTATMNPYVVLIGSNGVAPITNVVVKNSTLKNGDNSTTSVVMIGDDTVNTSGYFNDITIQNNKIQNGYNGIFAYAVVSAGNGNNLLISENNIDEASPYAITHAGVYLTGVDGATISENTIANFESDDDNYDKGVFLAEDSKNINVSNNTISNLHYNAGSTTGSCGVFVRSDIANANINIVNNTISDIVSNGNISEYTCGIDIFYDTSGVLIENNKISNIKNTSTGGYSAVGILLESSLSNAETIIQNNFIFDVAGYGFNSLTNDNGYGIQMLSGGGYQLYHNSVSLATNQTSTSGYPAALMISSGITQAATLDVRNNIFSVPATVGTNRYAVLCNAPKTVFSHMDYNIYYTSGSNLAYMGSNRATLVDMILGFGDNTHIASELPNFVSASNLHLTVPGTASAIESGGVAISGLTTDIDGDTRPNVTAPDIGADEYGGVAMGTIVMSANPGTDICVGDATELTASSSTSYAYTWTQATGLSGTSGTTVTATPSSDITYYVLAVSGITTKVAGIDIQVSPAPNDVTIDNPNATICGGSIQTITATGGNSGGGMNQNFDTSSYPSGWFVQEGSGDTVDLENSNNAGGSPYEVVITGNSFSNVTDRLIYGPFDSSGSSTLTLAWNNYLNHYSSTYPYQVVIQTSSNGSTWNNTAWNVNPVTADIAVGIQSTTISTADVGSATLYIAFTMQGETFGAFDWSIDNVELSGLPSSSLTWTSSPAIPNTMFTDVACTIPYVSGDFTNTLYVNPLASTIYTATASNGSCSKTDTVTLTVETATYNGSWTPALSSNQSIEIHADYTLANDLDVCACKVNATKKLTIPATISLIVQNAIENNGEIIVENTGSLVQVNETDTNTGSGVYKIKKTTGTYKNYDYFYWSSPVGNETVGSVFPTVNYKYKFNPDNYLDTASGHGYPQPTASAGDGYDDDGNDWTYINNSYLMPKGIGFIAMGKDSPNSFSVGQMGVSQVAFDVTFEGENIHNGTFTAEVKQDAYSPGFNANNNNLNLLGNPYPSAIDVFELYHDNASVLKGEFYFWTHDAPLAAIGGPNTYDFNNNNFAIGTITGTYPTYTYTKTLSGTGKSAPQYIASAQGFMASVIDGISNPANVSYKNSMRVAGDNTTFLKQVDVQQEADRIWLNLTSESNFSQIAIGFDATTEDTYGRGDTPRIDSANATDFYSLVPNDWGHYAIQFLSEFNDSKMIPLGIEIQYSGNYQISLDQFDGIFTQGQAIYLEDTYENVIHDLGMGAYIFTQTAGTNINDRFVLRFTNSALSNEETALSQVKVYPNPSTGVFNVAYYGTATLQYTVYDLTGKTVFSGTGNQINLTNQAIGMYFAKITDGKSVRTIKLVKE